MELRKSCLGMLVAVLAFGATVSACGEDADEDADLYTLSGAVADPVAITLSGALGTIVFDTAADPIPVEPKDTLVGLLTSGVIGLSVENTETSVTNELTSGTLVDVEPTQAGEYRVQAAEDGSSITITFVNEFLGTSLRADGQYTASVTVGFNDFFVDEAFTRSVSITQQ